MAIIRIQNISKQTKGDGVGSTVTKVLAAPPAAGSLMVAWLSNGDVGGDITVSSFSDNFGDGVSWNPLSINPVPITIGSGVNYRGYWKKVGTPSGGGMDVQCTITGTQALMLFVGEYGTDGAPLNWGIVGGPIFDRNVSPNFPADAGDVTVAGAAVLTGFSANQNQHWGAGTGYTVQDSTGMWKADRVEDRIVSTGGTYPIDWTSSSEDDTWVALGVAFGDVGGGPTVSTVSSNNANEGTAIVHTVTLASAVSGSPAVYALALAGVTATGGGVDFTSALTNSEFSDGVTISGGDITVPVAVSSFTVTVPTINDVIAEPAETYTLTVGGVSGTGTINASDAEYGVMATQITRHGNGRHASYGLQRGYT